MTRKKLYKSKSAHFERCFLLRQLNIYIHPVMNLLNHKINTPNSIFQRTNENLMSFCLHLFCCFVCFFYFCNTCVIFFNITNFKTPFLFVCINFDCYRNVHTCNYYVGLRVARSKRIKNSE